MILFVKHDYVRFINSRGWSCLGRVMRDQTDDFVFVRVGGSVTTYTLKHTEVTPVLTKHIMDRLLEI